jgi:3',5'-cyclic AMP phosphodiesterase CpdA
MALAAVAAIANAATGDTLGVSTVVQRIVPTGDGEFRTLTTADGEDHTVRDGSEAAALLGEARPGRENRRRALAYFGQFTDFQLADEESPARVEFLDPQGSPFTSAWRAAEALNPHEENAMIEQMNAFAGNAPHTNGDGRKRPMDFVVNTGDIADSQQYNEVLWNRQLLDGEVVNPGSGVDPAPYIGKHPLCPPSMSSMRDQANPAAYTGVQDRDDWPDGKVGYFYDPDDPVNFPGAAVNPYSSAPSYPGLMDKAQQPFRATGLDVPGRMVFGNHDALVQGNAWANQVFNELATGCLKPVNDAEANSGRGNDDLFGLVANSALTSADVLALYQDKPEYFMEVPPDPQRRLVPKKEYMDIFRAGRDPGGHGFAFTDPAERAASNGSAGYYSFSPRRGVRFVSLDTNSEGGLILVSSSGNLDFPQYRWFENELKKATARNEIVVVFSHHAITSLVANVPDENAPSCSSVDAAQVPGCDADPRPSTPIRLRDDLFDLLYQYPNAIAWVAGHSHDNLVTPYRNPEGENGFWSIKTAALADWPRQNRLVEIFDNRDGNLSIFGTIIDHAAPVPAPEPGSPAAGMSVRQLGSVARTIGFNDNQSGGDRCAPNRCGEGQPRDRNVELLIKDPRRPQVDISRVTLNPKKRPLRAGRRAVLNARITNLGTIPARRLRVRISSSNRQVKVRRIVTVRKIGVDRTVRVRLVVRATRRARGRARITVRADGRSATSVIQVRRRR